ncbi:MULTISPECIES: GNAT family N-acetyltransferase [Arthrobacter]|uniref:GNAT family N-acetyltransferase n=1 Tax=Arthrobacter sunyaminii TaxID=2816859 RepID=A0A975PCH5_9MICC|nr:MULTISPECIES: GNAT family N-acetyltransferase [Arthrobacter]MBO0907644.1 GNAT family N-acetyltransferase [Arthrobacter sunyaminii]QWQ35205.1 GNAT family N-acetyltransferase [Arthrobacter sunyaminii]
MPYDIPVLSESELTLRPHHEADIDPVLSRCVDPLTRRWTTVPLDYTREMAVEYVAAISVPQEKEISWALEAGGAYAGTLDLRFKGANSGDLGFVTAPEYRGKGLMSRAVGLAVAYALDDLGWDVVSWSANAGNVGSYKSVWRNGFPPPIAVPHFLPHRGKMVEGWVSSLAAEAPRKPSGSWAQWNDVAASLPQPSSPPLFTPTLRS